jgi:hypothetical protein
MAPVRKVSADSSAEQTIRLHYRAFIELLKSLRWLECRNAVAHTSHLMNQGLLETSINLGAQTLDVDIHNIG